MKGFAESQNYYVALFQPRGPTDISSVREAMPIGSGGTMVLADDDEWDCYHSRLHSRKPYVLEGKLVQVPTESGVYMYDFYFGNYTIRGSRRHYVAFPFRGVGREVFEAVGGALDVERLDFGVPDLDQIVEWVRGGDSRLDIAGYAADVLSDPYVDVLDIRGKSVVRSNTFAEIIDRLPHLNLNSRVCSVGYRISEDDVMRVHLDRYGNMRFYLRAKASNLRAVLSLGRLLEMEGHLTFRAASPFDRTLFSDEEEE